MYNYWIKKMATEVKDHKYSFNIKYQQNPMSRKGEIDQSVNFWIKQLIKGKKNSRSRPQMQFINEVLAKSNDQIGRNWPKCKFLGQKGQILVKKGPKRFLSKLSLGNYSNRP